MQDYERTLRERRAEETAPAEFEPSEVFTISSDKGGKLIFYSDRSVQAMLRDNSRGESFRDITAVDVFREPTRRVKLYGRGIVVFGLLSAICWTVWTVWQALDLLIVVVGWVVGGVVALVGAVKSADHWHMRAWNSSGKSKSLVSSRLEEEVTRLAQEASEALFKGEEKCK